MGSSARVSLASLILAGACGGKVERIDPYPATPAAWDAPVARPTDDEALAGRAACRYGRGAMPQATLGPSTPVADEIPIDTIVVLMMENRSFDHYLGHLGEFTGKHDVEAAPADASNPDRAGGAHPWRHAPHLCAPDTEHSWSKTHLEWDDGKMDGFFEANALDRQIDQAIWGDRALYWYDQRDLDYYYALAATFAVADHYHASALGPTYPNRQYLLAASSFGNTANDVPGVLDRPFPRIDVSVLDELEKRHTSWTLFSDGAPGAATLFGSGLAVRWGRKVTGSLTEFRTHAAAGTLPQVSFVDPNFARSSPMGEDEHPPADVQLGERFVANIVHAVLTSPQWRRAALFVVYDENGGYYDHVPPPRACAPDDQRPTDAHGRSAGWAFDRFGARVPLILVSPFAKPGYVGHTTYDHTSITRFIETRFRLPALSARDANADPMLDLFDFAQPSFAAPPALPAPALDEDELAWCKATLSR